MNFARLQPNLITGAILRIFTSSQALLELLYVCTVQLHVQIQVYRAEAPENGPSSVLPRGEAARQIVTKNLLVVSCVK